MRLKAGYALFEGLFSHGKLLLQLAAMNIMDFTDCARQYSDRICG